MELDAQHQIGFFLEYHYTIPTANSIDRVFVPTLASRLITQGFNAAAAAGYAIGTESIAKCLHRVKGCPKRKHVAFVRRQPREKCTRPSRAVASLRQTMDRTPPRYVDSMSMVCHIMRPVSMTMQLSCARLRVIRLPDLDVRCLDASSSRSSTL
jgi:hypothetical protein